MAVVHIGAAKIEISTLQAHRLRQAVDSADQRGDVRVFLRGERTDLDAWIPAGTPVVILTAAGDLPDLPDYDIADTIG
ncbi:MULTISPECIES: hypothetical protein [unclassified Microbacterium]|uniref:hypothetical protein n=1 Tax=unclassified Microbacterium TaxID=2609290 RepID=UPI003015FC7B